MHRARFPRRENRGVNAKERLRSSGYRLLGYESTELRVERYRTSHRDLWEGFIPSSANGNLFQTRRFLEYHPADRFEDHSLLFWRDKTLLAVAPGEAKEEAWSSHRFASHGGLVVPPRLSASSALDLVDALRCYGERQGWRKLFLRFVPDLLAEESFVSLVWALAVFGFSEDSREMTWCVLPQFSSEENLLQAYDESVRRAIKKAQKREFRIEESDDFPAFWALLSRNLRDKFDVGPTHSLAEIESIRARCPGEMRLHGVFHRREMVCGSLVFNLSSNVAHCFYFAQDYAFQGDRPMALLMHHLNGEYVLRQRRKLDYGVFTAEGAKELNLGLSRFKSSFAAAPGIRRRFTWEKEDR
jgi:hypothetical protein